MKKYFSDKYLEFYYYVFFAIMIINQFLPSIDSNKVSIILGGLGFLFVLPKILLTKYTKREAWIIAIIGILSIVTTILSRRQGLLFSALAIVGIKNIDIKKCIKIILFIGGTLFTIVVISYILSNGLDDQLTSTRYIFGRKIQVYKTSFGYNHANKAFALYSTLVLAFLYLNYERVSVKQWISIIVLTLGIFYFTFSRTGLIVILFSIVYYSVLESKLYNNKILKKILLSVPLASVAISFILPYLYVWGKIPFMEEINKVMAGRVKLSYEFLNFFKPTLFGQCVDDLTAYRLQTNNWYLICDNSYVLILSAYGILAFLLCLYLIYKLSSIAQEDRSKLFVLSSFCVYGIAEAFFIIFFVNFSMLFVKDILFKKTDEKEMSFFKCIFTIKNIS